jgi:hypothetical protein
MMKAARVMTLQPLLGQDVWVIEHEQDGWERHWDKPTPELSPVVKAFQDLTIRKWQEFLDQNSDAGRHGKSLMRSAVAEEVAQ